LHFDLESHTIIYVKEVTHETNELWHRNDETSHA